MGKLKLRRLIELDLSNNLIENIPDFSDMPLLEKLNLKANEIDTLYFKEISEQN